MHDLYVPAEALSEPLLLVTSQGRILTANSTARRELGIIQDAGEELGDFLADPEKSSLHDYLLRCATSDGPLPGVLVLRDAEGVPRDFRVEGWRQDGGICLHLRPRIKASTSFMALNDKVERLGHEVAVRLRSEDRLRNLLRDKEVLIRELHHRIRNTLQILSSLCNLQARTLPEGDARRPLLRQVRHISAVGAVMRTLYREGDMAEVDVRAFAEAMCANQAAPRSVATTVEFEVGRMDLDTATPFALAFDELLAEVLEGLPQDGSAHLRVALTRNETGLELVLDHGGLARLRVPGAARERILATLMRQLEGQLERGQAATRLAFADPARAAAAE
ncbi:sensor histidine kinase [Arenibaculum pallidiluteum]|uniref:sensor histidine kinase n=1 Tax=Arenibaculum pallidiluteum TaxID=2812559 RepID=UPI001A97D2B1|nr:sensor histidine kinase [Arenibaculum pallidiluteum]